MGVDARSVPCQLLSWPAVVNLLPEQKMVFSFLWFNHFSNSAGCYLLPLAPAAAELSLSPASLSEALSEFERRGLVERDETTGEILVSAWFRFNKFPAGPRRRVLLDDLKKIESQRLKIIVEKLINNTMGCIYDNEESTTYAPREGKESPLPRGLPCLPPATWKGKKLKIWSPPPFAPDRIKTPSRILQAGQNMR